MIQLLENGFDADILEKIQNFVHSGADENDFSFIGSGKNADVFRLNGTQIAVKKFYSNAKDTKDHIPLERLRGLEYFPTLYAYEPSKFMAMELVEGKTIYAIEGRDNLLYREYGKALKIAAEKAMERGLFTNDVHLNNIMIGYNGNIKIVDVGRFTFEPTTEHQLFLAAYSSPSRPWTGTRYIPNHGTWTPGTVIHTYGSSS